VVPAAGDEEVALASVSPMSGKPKQKITYIETMRGFACLLLVFYHVIGTNETRGLHLPDDHFLHVFNTVVGTVRMPLFSYFSGFVFAAVVLSFEQWKGKVSAKVRRLLVPFVVVGSVHYFLQSLTTTPEMQYYETFYLTYDHFWFLQATFTIMLAHLTLSWVLKGNGVHAAQIIFAVGVTGTLAFEHQQLPFFSFYMALYLAPFFTGGHLLHHYLVKWNEQPTDRRRTVVATITTAVLVAAYALETAIAMKAVTLDHYTFKAFLMLLALGTCFFFAIVRFNSPFLIYIGDKSYTIYLFHVIFAASAREVLMRLIPTIDPLWLIPPIFLVGIGGPMVLQWLILKHPVSAYLFLGLKLRPKPRQELAGAGGAIAVPTPATAQPSG
jgi:peptidoglycan/LPS O-acetylase OafA/YrhL